MLTVNVRTGGSAAGVSVHLTVEVDDPDTTDERIRLYVEDAARAVLARFPSRPTTEPPPDTTWIKTAP